MSARARPSRKWQSGLTLIELTLFIVIVSIAVVGVLQVYVQTSPSSADPQLRKQALAIAEAMLEEVEMMPFTVCDPDFFDPATSACTLAESMGPEAGEARGDAVKPFDNVNDYNGFSSSTLTSLGGAIAIPSGYNVQVAVAQDAGLGPAGAQPSATQTLRITVTVRYNNNNDQIVLEGYRTQYAPDPI